MPVVAFALLPGRKDKNGNDVVWDEYDLAGLAHVLTHGSWLVCGTAASPPTETTIDDHTLCG